jgi:hypothetical protein
MADAAARILNFKFILRCLPGYFPVLAVRRHARVPLTEIYCETCRRQYPADIAAPPERAMAAMADAS